MACLYCGAGLGHHIQLEASRLHSASEVASVLLACGPFLNLFLMQLTLELNLVCQVYGGVAVKTQARALMSDLNQGCHAQL